MVNNGYMIVIIHRNPTNVNAGLINPVKRLFNWEGTIKKYQMKWLFLIFINHGLAKSGVDIIG